MQLFHMREDLGLLDWHALAHWTLPLTDPDLVGPQGFHPGDGIQRVHQARRNSLFLPSVIRGKMFPSPYS